MYANISCPLSIRLRKLEVTEETRRTHYILTLNLVTEVSVLSQEGKGSCICAKGIYFDFHTEKF
jgi:hypothetical protein